LLSRVTLTDDEEWVACGTGKISVSKLLMTSWKWMDAGITISDSNAAN